MNRLQNYLKARQLANLYLQSAGNAKNQGDFNSAICHAVKYLITANNNLQSLAFNQKPKGRKP